MSILDANTLAAGFANEDITVGLHVFDRLPSTQEFLKERASVEDVPAVEPGHSAELCICDWQTDGSGRRGRSWSSQPGNVTLSLLTNCSRNQNELMGLSLVTGICISETIKELTGFDAKAKWPNDVIIKDKKLAGILVDVLPHPGAKQVHIVTGIGINYQEEESRLESDGMNGTSLSVHGEILPSRDELVVAIVRNLLRGYAEFESDGWGAFVDRWDALDYLRDKQVDIERQKGEKLAGQVAGVAPDGALLVDSGGEVKSYHNAEISVRIPGLYS